MNKRKGGLDPRKVEPSISVVFPLQAIPVANAYVLPVTAVWGGIALTHPALKSCLQSHMRCRL